MLVLTGATPDGRTELVAVVDGFRESKQSWYELLIDLKQRGLATAPKVAAGDGALGFWAALREVFGKTDVGFTRQATSSSECPRAFTAKRSQLSMKSGWR
jgi:transposase-like protein